MGTHPIFESDFDCLTDAMGKSISRLGSTMCGIGVININENKYIFHKQIGEGAFSYVDLIEDLKDGTNFALKRIICHDKKSEQEALKEAKDSSSFDTPFIVSAREFCVRKKSPYSEVWIVLPFYDKGTLWDHFQRLKKTGKIFSEGEILNLFRGIVAGVAEIHKSGYVHRDLKPANVLLTDDLKPVLCDLGSLAPDNLQINNSKEARTLQDLAGERSTLPYRAPELLQVEPESTVTSATDIWSLGCILYSLINLEGPFDVHWLKGDSVHLAVQSAKYDKTKIEEMSGPIKALVEQTLELDPKYRPPAELILKRIDEAM